MSRHVLFLRNDESEHPEGSLDHDEQQYLEELRQKEEESHKTKMLTISFILMLVFGLSNKITQVLQLDYIQNYPLFLSLITTFIYIPASLLYVLPMIKYGSAITPEQRAIPMTLWMKIGALDGLAGLMQILTINIIRNGTLIVLVSQCAIPISMICSKYGLGAKYTTAHYIGVFIVLCGLAVVLVPRFLKKGSDDEDAPSTTKLAIALAVFAASNIPMCLSTVVKERALGDTNVDPIYLNLWVAVWQFLFSIPMLIPSAYTEGVAINHLPQNLVDGFKCWMGINTIKDTHTAMAAVGLLYYSAQQIAASTTLQRLQAQVNGAQYSAAPVVASPIVPKVIGETENDFYPYTHLSSPLADLYHHKEFLRDDNGMLGDDKKPDNCHRAPFFTNAYMCANLFYNILIIMLIKYGSSVLFYISMSILLPLSSFAFALPFMPKPTKLSIFDISGLFVLLIGLSIYRFYNSIFGKKQEDTPTENQEALLSGGINSDTEGMIIQDQAVAPHDNSFTKKDTNPYYVSDFNANVDDPFGDNGQDDGYDAAEIAPTIASTGSSINQGGKKKGKKGKK